MPSQTNHTGASSTSNTRNLKTKIHNSVHAAEDLLIKMMETPIRSHPQINRHTKYLKKMSSLMYKMDKYIFDVGTVHKDHTNDVELEDLSTP